MEGGVFEKTPNLLYKARLEQLGVKADIIVTKKDDIDQAGE